MTSRFYLHGDAWGDMYYCKFCDSKCTKEHFSEHCGRMQREDYKRAYITRLVKKLATVGWSIYTRPKGSPTIREDIEKLPECNKPNCLSCFRPYRRPTGKWAKLGLPVKRRPEKI